MKLLGCTIFALLIGNVFLAGMMYADLKKAPSKEQCEQVVGEGNCLRINGYLPEPRPDTLAVPASPLPEGRNL